MFEFKLFREMKTRELATLVDEKIKYNEIDKNVKGVIFLDSRHNLTFFDMYNHTVEHFNSRNCDIIEKLCSFKYEYGDIGIVIKLGLDEEFEYIKRECDVRYATRTIN